MARFIAPTLAKSVFRQPLIIPPKKLFSQSCLSKRNLYVFKDFTFLRLKSALKRLELKTNWRQISDKMSEKGRGDEMNYFLKIAREQFEMLRKRRMQEIREDIQALEAEVRDMDNKTSHRANKVRENLMKEIKELKDTLGKFKKSLEKEKK